MIEEQPSINHSAEPTIDVEQPSAVDPADSEPIEDHAVGSAPEKPAQSSPKRKPLDVVLVDRSGLADLSMVAESSGPLIGLVLGSINHQTGAALINGIFPLARCVKTLCSWKVSPSIIDVQELAIGFVIKESSLVDYSFDIARMKELLPPAVETALLLKISQEMKTDSISVQYNCETVPLVSLKEKVKVLSMKKCPLYGTPRHVPGTFWAEFKETCNLLSSSFSDSLVLKARLMNRLGQMNEDTWRSILDGHVRDRFERVLLELRRNIQQRISDLEKTWTAKRAKVEDDGVGRPDPSQRFKSHLTQLMNKELGEIQPAPTTPTLPSRPSTLISKSSRPSSAPQPKRRPSKVKETL